MCTLLNMTTYWLSGPYWLAMSINVFVCLLYCKCLHINKMALSSLLTFCSTRPRLENVLQSHVKTVAFSTFRAWVDFGLCRWWSDSQRRHCRVCKTNMTSLIKYGAHSAKWNTHPTSAVTSPIYKSCNNITLCLYTFYSIDVYEQGVQWSRQGLTPCEIVGTTLMCS